MPNANVPSGFSPVRDVSGRPWNGAVNQFSVPTSDATAIFVGDPVKLVGTSQIINGQVFPDVAQAATTDIIVGVVIGFLAADRDSSLYRVASTQRIAIVCDDPNALFEVQDISTGTPLTIADIGFNASFALGAGNTFTGLSTAAIDNTTEAGTNTLALKIVGFANRADNDSGTAEASKKFYVRINRHQYVNQVAGI